MGVLPPDLLLSLPSELIPRPPGSIWRTGDGIWKLKGVFEEKNKCSDNFDPKPEIYL